MAVKRVTGFDRYVATRMKSKTFADAHAQATAEISATDAIVRKIDEARDRAQITKAVLARRAGMSPEAVRRLLTAQDVNPTLDTISRLATELGMKLTLVKA